VLPRSIRYILLGMAGYLHQPNIDPVLIRLWGPFQIRWYSLLYVGGFIAGRWVLLRLAKEDRFKFDKEDVEQFVLWALISAVVGARIVYCVFYDPKSLIENPLYLFQVYRGGLSFHGGLLGVLTSAIVFSRKKKIPFANLADAYSIATPIGLGMGRLGNFINGELYGRVSYVPWAIVFRDGGPQPRHPSQLYEFFLEGVVLFFVLWFLRNRLKKDGSITIVFLLLYSLFRFLVEFFREPDAHLGFIAMGLTMGQLLSLAMFLISSYFGYRVFSGKPKRSGGGTRRRKP